MEQILFSMPEDKELFLAALAAVQSWKHEQKLQVENSEIQIKSILKEADTAYKRKRLSYGQFASLQNNAASLRQGITDRDYTLHIHMHQAFNWLLPCFGNVVLEHEFAPKREDWDLVYRFDRDVAYNFAKCTEKHVAMAFGQLIGADPFSAPDLTAIKGIQVTKRDILLLDFPSAATIELFVKKNYPEKVCHHWPESVPVNSIHGYNTVAESSMIIGPRGMATYLGCCLSKRVVELYSTDCYQRWLSKWDSPNYQMLYGDEIAPGVIWTAMESLWDRPLIIRSMSDFALKTLTAQRMSVAGSAVASLPELETQESVQ